MPYGTSTLVYLDKLIASAQASEFREGLDFTQARQVTMYGPEAQQEMARAAVAAARTKDELADIINVAIKELVRQRFELPAFGTLIRVARTARTTVIGRIRISTRMRV